MGRLREKLRGKLLIPCCIAALGVALALIVYFIYILALQTGWKKDVQLLERQFSKAYESGAEITCDGKTLKADARALNYYLRILNMPGLMATRWEKDAFSRENDRLIALKLPDYTLYYTVSRDGFSICVYWQDGDKLHAYAVNGGVEFHHLETYFGNLMRSTQATGE